MEVGKERGKIKYIEFNLKTNFKEDGQQKSADEI